MTGQKEDAMRSAGPPQTQEGANRDHYRREAEGSCRSEGPLGLFPGGIGPAGITPRCGHHFTTESRSPSARQIGRRPHRGQSRVSGERQ